MKIVFKNLDRSELISDVARTRIHTALARFPKANPRSVCVTIGMENSPLQPGPDLFKVRVEIVGGLYHGVILEREAADPYDGIASLSDGLLERLNRYSDRLRLKNRKLRTDIEDRRRSFSR